MGVSTPIPIALRNTDFLVLIAMALQVVSAFRRQFLGGVRVAAKESLFITITRVFPRLASESWLLWVGLGGSTKFMRTRGLAGTLWHVEALDGAPLGSRD